MQTRLTVPFLVLAAALSAQTYTVSPASYATIQGVSNPHPFSTANARYQQIHGDLRGSVRLLQGMAVRRGPTNGATAVMRTLDLTVRMANSDRTQVSATFAANYAAAPTTVVPRGPTSFPDWTVSIGVPEPWTVVIPFTTPFVYLGMTDLLWEWVVENNTGSGQNYQADTYSGINADILNSTSAAIGTACRATGQNALMTYAARCYTSRVLNALYFRGTASAGAANSPSAILFGATNPNLTFPGLCTGIYTDMLVSFPSVASATGSFSMPDLLVPYDPNWQGVKFYSQALSSDLGQPGLPFALSAGLENTIPAMQPPGAEPLIRIFDIASATSTVGMVNFYAYGLIVRFTH